MFICTLISSSLNWNAIKNTSHGSCETFTATIGELKTLPIKSHTSNTENCCSPRLWYQPITLLAFNLCPKGIQYSRVGAPLNGRLPCLREGEGLSTFRVFRYNRHWSRVLVDYHYCDMIGVSLCRCTIMCASTWPSYDSVTWMGA